jgi:hypothetical protein
VTNSDISDLEAKVIEAAVRERLCENTYWKVRDPDGNASEAEVEARNSWGEAERARWRAVDALIAARDQAVKADAYLENQSAAEEKDG